MCMFLGKSQNYTYSCNETVDQGYLGLSYSGRLENEGVQIIWSCR